MPTQKIELIKSDNNQHDDSKDIVFAAAYARYSTKGNSPYSADEQIQRIRHHLEQGKIKSKLYPNAKIILDDKWIIKDEAKSGRVTREGYELIKSGIATKAFELLIMDDLSRMTRDMGDCIDLYEELIFHDVEGYSLSDRISTTEPHTKDLFVFKSYANEQLWKNTSKSTMRGHEVRVLSGFSTGNNPYGYYSEPTKRTIIKGREVPSHFAIKIDYEKAQIINKIWQMYVDGFGCRSIAKALNNENVPPPSGRGRRGKDAQRWGERQIWAILNQDKYIGISKYRQTKMVKNPKTNKLTKKPRPKSEWLVTKRKDLRIIPPELEKQVNKIKENIKKTREKAQTKEERIFSGRGKPTSHLFIGTMKCGLCGATFALLSGKSGGYVGCPNAHRQNLTKCSNKRLVRMSLVENNLIDELKTRMDATETWQYLAKRYNE